MIRVTRVQTRPSTDVDFFKPRLSKLEYTMNNFVNTGKLSITNSISDDKLIRTSVWDWVDSDSFDDYNNNELVQLVKQEEQDYITEHGMTLVSNITII